jgi:hypothetical protein
MLFFKILQLPFRKLPYRVAQKALFKVEKGFLPRGRNHINLYPVKLLYYTNKKPLFILDTIKLVVVGINNDKEWLQLICDALDVTCYSLRSLLVVKA